MTVTPFNNSSFLATKSFSLENGLLFKRFVNIVTCRYWFSYDSYWTRAWYVGTWNFHAAKLTMHTDFRPINKFSATPIYRNFRQQD